MRRHKKCFSDKGNNQKRKILGINFKRCVGNLTRSHSSVESNEQNKVTHTIKPEAGTHGTDRQISEGRGCRDWKTLAEERHAQPVHTDNSVVNAGVGKWAWGLGGEGLRGEVGDTSNSVNNKNKEST